jgi:flagellin
MASFGDLNRVNTNIQSLDSQLSLNRINKDLADNQIRLSTGLRINSAEDDAAGFSIATKLNSRVAGLEQAMRNVGDAKSVLDIAESSFDTIMDNLVEMKGLATQAANDTLGSEERGFIGDQLSALGADINEVANQTVFQDFQLLSGENESHSGNLNLTFQVGERAEDTISADLEAVNVNELFAGSESAYTVDSQDVAGSSIGGNASAGTTGSSVTSITIEDGSSNTVGSVSSLTIDTTTVDATSMQAVADEINNLNIEDVTASVNDAGDGLVIENTSASEDYTVTFGGDFNGDGTAQTLDATSTAATADVSGQGAMSFEGWEASDFRSFISDVDSAINSMSERVNDIGIAQSSLSTREVTLSQSVSANSSAASRIMDADFAKEQSESVRLQILQQTATSALAQANMGPQSVLGFLG